jgi:hypothetical protein
MPSRYRSMPVIAAIFALLALPLRAVAEPPFTILGTGVTARPYVLWDDLVVETDGVDAYVRDYADPAQPRWYGEPFSSAQMHWSDVVANDGLVVVINTDPLFYPVGYGVIDFSNPAAPVELHVTAGLACRSVWLSERALICDLETGILAYDLTEPAAPAFSGGLVVGQHPGRRWLSVVGNEMYLIDHGSVLRRLDVADPRHPVDRGLVTTVIDGRIDALVGGDGVLHGLVAAPDGTSGTSLDLVTWDCTEPGSPVESARERLFTGADAAGRVLVLDGDLLLAAGSDARLRAFGMDTPTAPRAGWVLPLDTGHVALGARTLHVVTDSGLHVYPRTAADAQPPAALVYPVLPRFQTITGEGAIQIAQLRSDDSVLMAVDVSEPARPRLEKPFQTGLSGRLQFAGGLGLMLDGPETAQLLDLSDPRAPRRRGRIGLPGTGAFATLHARGMVTIDYGLEDTRLDIWDVRDPDQPRFVRSIADRSAVGSDGRWLVCGTGAPYHYDDPRLYKLDDDYRPEFVGELQSSLWTVWQPLVVGDCVYLFGQNATATDLMEIHRLSGPPTRLQVQSLGFAPILATTLGNLLFVQGNYRCHVYDVSQADDPEHLGSFAADRFGGAGFARNGNVLTVSGQLITVGSGLNATAAAPLPAASAAVHLEPAQPNPFNPSTRLAFTVDREQFLTVAIHDVRGRLVRELAGRQFAPGRHEFAWDGTGDGAPAPSGVYFARVHGDGVEAVQPMTLLK